MRLLLCWQERVLWSPGLSELQEYRTTLKPGGEVLPYRYSGPVFVRVPAQALPSPVHSTETPHQADRRTSTVCPSCLANQANSVPRHMKIVGSPPLIRHHFPSVTCASCRNSCLCCELQLLLLVPYCRAYQYGIQQGVPNSQVVNWRVCIVHSRVGTNRIPGLTLGFENCDC